MIDWNEIKTFIAQELLTILIPVVVTFAFYWARKAAKAAEEWYQKKVSQETRAQIEAVVGVGIRMAEQIGMREDVQAAGAEKRDMAFAYINDKLRRMGIQLEAEDIYAQIEAQVLDEFNYKKATK
jgi:hypothetical protein